MKMTSRATVKPYNIVFTTPTEAEINMYGEVVEDVPIDWWTGLPVDGLFIALDDFLIDLEQLNACNKITVHINSVGGDMYAGISIYNRLKNMPAEIVTINDGLAASAGSIIFQAGNTRLVNPGSNIMVHQAMGRLSGYYNVTDLRRVIKQLDAANKAGVAIYAEASGRDAAEMKALVDRETWLTGQEAVDAGLADEVITGEDNTQVSMSLSHDRTRMLVNGVLMSCRGMSNIPSRIPVMPATENIVSPAAPAPVEDKTNNDERSTDMDINIKNIDEMRAAFPDFLAQAETAARDGGHAAGVAEERARIQGIEAIEAAIADKALVNAAKYGDTPLTAEQLAFRAMQAQAALGATMLTQIAADSAESGAEEVAAAPNAGPETSNVEPVDEAAQIQDAIKVAQMIRNGGRN